MNEITYKNFQIFQSYSMIEIFYFVVLSMIYSCIGIISLKLDCDKLTGDR